MWHPSEFKTHSPMHKGFLASGFRFEKVKTRSISSMDGAETEYSYTGSEAALKKIKKYLISEGFGMKTLLGGFYDAWPPGKGLISISKKNGSVTVTHIISG